MVKTTCPECGKKSEFEDDFLKKDCEFDSVCQDCIKKHNREMGYDE